MMQPTPMTTTFALLNNPAAISLAVGSHILLGGVDIYREISAAYTNFFANEYEEFGRDIGAAFALVYIGPAGVNKLTKEDQAKLKDMIELSLYPSLTQDIYQDEDETAYQQYLIYLSESR